MQTDRREKQCDKELKLLKKLSMKVFSFIQLQNRSHKYLLFLLRKKFTLLLVIRFAWFAASFTIKSLCSSYKLVAIQFFYLSIWIFTKKRVFCVVGLSNLKIFNKKKIKNRAKSAFLEYLEAQILKISHLSTNHGGALVGLMCVHVCPKSSGYVAANHKVQKKQWNNNRWCWRLRFGHADVDFDKMQYVDKIFLENATLKNDQKNYLWFILCWIIFFNWDSLHARLNSHYEAWSYKEKEAQKD